MQAARPPSEDGEVQCRQPQEYAQAYIGLSQQHEPAGLCQAIDVEGKLKDRGPAHCPCSGVRSCSPERGCLQSPQCTLQLVSSHSALPPLSNDLSQASDGRLHGSGCVPLAAAKSLIKRTPDAWAAREVTRADRTLLKQVMFLGRNRTWSMPKALLSAHVDGQRQN